MTARAPTLDPVLAALETAPVVAGEPTAEELEQIAAWEAGGKRIVDSAAVTAKLAAMRDE